MCDNPKLSDIKPGDKLRADDGFTCLKEGQVETVHKDSEGLYINCAQGEHYLDGQLFGDGTLVGLELAND